jgi:hypothetical protein
MTTTALPKGSKITGTDREKLGASLKKQYEKGSTIAQLVASTGRSSGFVQRLLVESGTTMRPRGGANNTKKA